LTEETLPSGFEPDLFTAAMIGREMPSAIKPPSMAVAIAWSFTVLEMMLTPGHLVSVQTIRSG
jgi:hypothetical protein